MHSRKTSRPGRDSSQRPSAGREGLVSWTEGIQKCKTRLGGFSPTVRIKSPLVVIVGLDGRSSLVSGLDHLSLVGPNPLVEDGERSDQDLGWLCRNTILISRTEGEVYDAERHLILGTSSSAPVLASLHYNWYTLDQPHLAGIYASRSVLPYLLVGNLASANAALSTFTSHLTTSNPHLLAMSQPIESSKSGLSLRIFPSIPLLNFLSLLLLAAQKGDAGLFRQLCKYYAPHLKDAETLWSDALSNIGEVWFGIRMPRQGGNPLFDMMGSMLFGGGGGGQGGQGRGGTPRSNTPKPVTGGKREIEKPPTMDLD